MAVKIKEEAKGIYRLGPLETNHDSGPTSPFLVVGAQRTMVAEPGQDGQAPQIVEAIKQLGISLDRVEHVWASHIHIYHVQGLSVLLKLLPKAKFLVHPRGARHVSDVTRLMEQTRQIFTVETPQDTASGAKKCYGPMQPVPADRVISVEDRQVFDLGGREVEIVYSPGHAAHHMGLFDRQAKVLFCGDLDTGAGSFGRAGETSVTIFNPQMHVDSMRRYMALNPSMLLRFGVQEAMPAEETLKEVEVDMLGMERIILQGLRDKVTLVEINRRVEQFRKLTGHQATGAEEVVGRRRAGAPPHLIAYILSKNPGLMLPADARPEVTPGHRMPQRA